MDPGELSPSIADFFSDFILCRYCGKSPSFYDLVGLLREDMNLVGGILVASIQKCVKRWENGVKHDDISSCTWNFQERRQY